MSSHLIDTSDEEDCFVAVTLFISDLLDEGQVVSPLVLPIEFTVIFFVVMVVYFAEDQGVVTPTNG